MVKIIKKNKINEVNEEIQEEKSNLTPSKEVLDDIFPGDMDVYNVFVPTLFSENNNLDDSYRFVTKNIDILSFMYYNKETINNLLNHIPSYILYEESILLKRNIYDVLNQVIKAKNDNQEDCNIHFNDPKNHCFMCGKTTEEPKFYCDVVDFSFDNECYLYFDELIKKVEIFLKK